MTNKEYLTQSLSGLNLSEGDIDLILLKGSLSGEANVDVAACDNAVYNRFSIVLKGALQNISEGGYSVSWNMDAVKMYYNALCNEWGKENILISRPKVRNRSNGW
ncbi:MAG: hypothetical protein EZS26_002943 [Candidatus Ordinivivax streblomastigis]|uniref:Uncharacterized protein n=1 Tax=Candidatus Ordinivivax streblomastigis TaxID=2540710 RepID=A0A5M8NWW4_9BACT|nr:MAG: hypothetical protein EZS26_002943 [Candidatus Ordinivivax streblomastigis]